LSSLAEKTKGGMLLRKVLVWGGIAFLIFFVAFRPGSAADVIRGLGTTAVDIFQGVGEFFGGLVD
jgi:hypothetical protein